MKLGLFILCTNTTRHQRALIQHYQFSTKTQCIYNVLRHPFHLIRPRCSSTLPQRHSTDLQHLSLAFMHGSKIYDTIIITMIIILALNNRLSIVAVENVQSENDLSVVLLVLATVHACPPRPTTSSFSAPNMQPAYTPFSSRKEKCSMPSIVMCIHIKVLEVLLHAHQGVVMLLHVATAVSWCDEACYCGLHGFTRLKPVIFLVL